MINVAIVTTNDNVAYAMSTVVAKRGAKSRHIKEYSFADVKTCSIVIFDLDHIDGYEDRIKKDSGGFKDLIAIGYGRDTDLMDDFRPIMTVREKPLLAEHLSKYLQDLKALRKSEQVINTDSNPICDPMGISVESLLDTEILSDRDRMMRLKKVVDKMYKGPGEEEFLDSIGIKDIKKVDRTAEIVVEEKQRAIDYRSQFIDDALIMYRAKKLKQMRLSVYEIDAKIKELMGNDIKRAKTKSSLFTEGEILEEFAKSKRYADIQEEIHKDLVEQPGSQEARSDRDAVKSFEEIELGEPEIEEQRKEAIGYPIPEDAEKKEMMETESYTSVERKYLRGDSVPIPKPIPQPQESSSARTVTVDVLSGAELSDRLHQKLSDKQIEKLRKLGVKI